MNHEISIGAEYVMDKVETEEQIDDKIFELADVQEKRVMLRRDMAQLQAIYQKLEEALARDQQSERGDEKAKMAMENIAVQCLELSKAIRETENKATQLLEAIARDQQAAEMM